MFQKFEIRDVVASIFILIGALLRFYSFDQWSLTNDELSAISRTNFGPFSELIDKGIWVDGHPALIQIFEFYWIQLSGNSVFAVRLPFVLMGVGSCIYFYRLLANWLNKNAALIGLSLFIPNYLFVLYSQIARPYVAGLFFVVAFSFYLFRFLRTNEVKKNAIGIILFGLAASLTHYFSALSIFLIYFIASIYWSRKNIKFYFLFAIAIVVLYLPHLPITLNHLSIGGVGWLPKPEPDYLKRFISYFFQDSRWYQISIACVLLVVGFKKGLQFNWKPLLICLFVFFSCFSIAYYYSIHRTPVIQFSVLIFASPFLLTTIASFIGKKVNSYFIMTLSTLLIFMGSFSLIAERSVYSKKPFANFKSVAENSVLLSEKLGRENVLAIANASNPFYLKYYTSRIDSSFEYNQEDIGGKVSLTEVRDALKYSEKDYVLISYANASMPNEIHEYAKQKYPEVYFHERYFNSDIIVYSKGNTERKRYFESDFLKHENWEVNKNQLQDSVFYSDSLSFHQTPNIPYALTYRNSLENFGIDKNKYLTMSAQLRSDSAVDVSLVVNVNRGDSSVYWRGTNVKPYFTKNSWYQFMFVFEKPKNLLPTDQVVIYFWNPNKQDLLIDDFKLYNFADSDYNYYEF